MKEALAWLEHCKSLAPAIVETCLKVPVSSGPGALVKALTQALPEWKFRHVMSRGGWYRLGGIVDDRAQRLSDNLGDWAEKALAQSGGDLAGLMDEFADQRLYATRLVGQTHYLVATAGTGSADFLQLEIEDLQEMRAHQLFANHPDTLDELLDPRTGADKPLALGLPFYAFRRLQHVGAHLRRMLAQRVEPAPIHRMLDDWSRSSAGNTSAYCNHWVIATREHLDRYQQAVFYAQAIATQGGNPPDFDADLGVHGLQLNEDIAHFDHQAGYPMAWYFLMLAGKNVPHWVAATVIEDSLAGFAYLPQRDIDVVRKWLHRPYTV
ncbi:MAG: hypothetical protein ABTR92_18630 [Candidatus Accumulibacter phosphatis]|jgi:hypothetical protein|uniref:hypothetical protein n=1 Tax=Candidatus Accumulibacter sp. ACC012 TaxID=2823332 RepID=UPI0025C5F0B0|nr:hypothetical protein [Candidatus Accumulibacter sp. ACC012]